MTKSTLAEAAESFYRAADLFYADAERALRRRLRQENPWASDQTVDAQANAAFNHRPPRLRLVRGP